MSADRVAESRARRHESHHVGQMALLRKHATGRAMRY